jgi:tRNA A37 threonylcarbamoyladenosine modification protein TsaB
MSDLLSEAGFNWTIAPSAFPSAKNMAKFIAEGLQQKVDVAYFEPFYLKDFVAEKSKKKWF